MPLGDTFAPAAALPPLEHPDKRRKHEAPFSLRLNAEERARLAAEAAGAPLGGYIKAKLLSSAPLRVRRPGVMVEDRQALAQLLALLGRSRLAANLNQLAHAANLGTLPLDPETAADLHEAVDAVRDLRRLLLLALGLKPEAQS